MAGEAARRESGPSARWRISSGGVAKSVVQALRRYNEEIVSGVPDTTASSWRRQGDGVGPGSQDYVASRPAMVTRAARVRRPERSSNEWPRLGSCV